MLIISRKPSYTCLHLSSFLVLFHSGQSFLQTYQLCNYIYLRKLIIFSKENLNVPNTQIYGRKENFLIQLINPFLEIVAYWKGKKKGRSTVSRSCREIGRKFSGCSIFRNDTSFYHLVNSIPGTVKGCALDRKNRTFEGLGKNSPPLQPRSGKSRITDGVRSLCPFLVPRSAIRSFLRSSSSSKKIGRFPNFP